MGLGPIELKNLQEIDEYQSLGKNCAILGDCIFWYDGGSKEDFKNKFGFERVDTFDILGNPSYRVDLNEPLHEDFRFKYDCVIDGGTLYSMFDVAMGFKNILHLLKPNGVVWHESSLAGHFGRGFYCLSPSLFNEFYSQNGFEVIRMAYKIKRQNRERWVDIQIGDDMLGSGFGGDTSLLCCAKRLEVIDFKKPVPQHYIDTNGK